MTSICKPDKNPSNDTHQALELLEHSRILAALSLKTQQRLASLTILDTVDSTNSYLFTMPQQLTPLACLAEYQTAGRGRYGRQWISPYASGLCLSVKQNYSVFEQSLAGLNIALTTSVMQVLDDLGATDIGIKWPNDIWWQNRKLAGLLLETRQNGGYEVVIGIGINVNMSRLDHNEITQPWVDLSMVFGHSVSRNVLAAMLIDRFCETLLVYPAQGLKPFLSLWQRFDLSYGREVTLKITSKQQQNDKKSVVGIANGIDEQGALLLLVGEHIQRYPNAEVSLVL